MFGLGNTSASNTKIFTPTTGVNGQGYQIWRKPPNISMVWFTILSGGGGGGGGGGVPSTTNTSGGGSGACSNVTKFMCSAVVLPNELYIQVGVGGQGGAGALPGNAGTAGTSGTNSFILTSPRTAVLPNIILYSGVTAPGGGGGGFAATTAVAGTNPSVPIIQPFNTLGTWSTIIGIQGGICDPNSNSNIAAWGTSPLTPGTPGGYVVSGVLAGFGTNLTLTSTVDLGAAGYYTNPLLLGGGLGSSPRLSGNNGIQRVSPLLNCGGTGGQGAVAGDGGIGGNGGRGGYGCGGGGGGAGTTRGGNGGYGGDGLVIISWV